MNILFDLDGTLVDTAGDILEAINKLCLELGKPLPNQLLLKNNTSFGLNKILPLALNSNLKIPIDAKQLAELKIRFKNLYRKTNFKHSKLFPGIQELLHKLKIHKFKTAIVTNKHYEFTYLILKKLEILELFDCIVTADMVANPKPAPDSVLLAINQLAAIPKQCLFIGDAEQDIIAGHKAGVQTVGALFGYIDKSINPNNWNADFLVNDSKFIWPLIEQLFLS